MKCGVQIWTVEKDYRQGRIPINDTFGCMDPALLKVHDGLEYIYYSVEDARVMADEVYRPQSIDMMPWGVGRGFSLDVAYEEGRLAGQYAAAIGREYILDLESDKEHYWQGIPGTPQAFCRGYEETSNGLRLRIQPDCRIGHEQAINLDEWIAEPIVGIWHPQIYASAYNESMDYWMEERRGTRNLIDRGVPKRLIYPTLCASYATAGDPSLPADILERDILYLHDQDYGGFVIFRRGVMDGLQVERVLAMENPWQPAPPEPSYKAKALERIAVAQVAMEEARVAVEAIP